MNEGIATRGEIELGSVLIFARASLIPVTRCLVAVGPNLILITRGLVPVTRRPDALAVRLAATGPGTTTPEPPHTGQITTSATSPDSSGRFALNWQVQPSIFTIQGPTGI